ncbi:MAG TPA: hypothetical protein ENI60_01300 [Candidatus Fraserbacteria bacterium]|nr:hypothetical protein [Candidatus Fraserbacteria bacterium]
MPLTKPPERLILTTLACPRCERVGRLYRKPQAEVPSGPTGNPKAEYYYTLRCPTCGEFDLWGLPAQQSSPDGAEGV